MALQNLIERKLVACQPSATVKEAARLMDSQNVGAVLVVEGGRPVGIVTDRDVVVRCVVQGNDCSQSRVSDIMTTELETVSLDEGLFDVVQKMGQNKIRRLPIVDHDGKAVGLISFGDIMQLIGKEMAILNGAVAPENPKIVDQAA